MDKFGYQLNNEGLRIKALATDIIKVILSLMTTHQLREICRKERIIQGIVNPLDKEELVVDNPALSWGAGKSPDPAESAGRLGKRCSACCSGPIFSFGRIVPWNAVRKSRFIADGESIIMTISV